MKGNFSHLTSVAILRTLITCGIFSCVPFPVTAQENPAVDINVIVNGQEIIVKGGNGDIQIINDLAPFIRINDLGNGDRSSTPSNPQNAPARDEMRPDRLEFFDGSLLKGELKALQARRYLVWKHPAAIGPVRFQYSSVASISLEGRTPPVDKRPSRDGLRCLLRFRNGDTCYGNLVGMDAENLDFSTSFAGQVKTPRTAIESLLALPQSFENLYDISEGMTGWKLPNAKSWKEEKGEFVSLSSGSMGRKFPNKETIALDFEVKWDRSFYFNVRIFSESAESTAYGSDAYNLSFSSNRVNLTANKNKKGRVVRETIGTANLSNFHHKKKARIVVYANRKAKTFTILVDDTRVARWQDGDEESVSAKGNAIVLYNQGGSAQLRISALSVTGWDGDFEPPDGSKQDPEVTTVTFVNGDGATGEVGDIRDGKLDISSSAGKFAVPLDRIRRISFAAGKTTDLQVPSDRVWLARGLGTLSVTLDELVDGKFTASSPVFGEITLSQNWLRRIQCNRHLIELEQYLATLRLADKAIAIRNFDVARDALLRAPPQYRGWQWGRLYFHLLSQASEQIHSISGHEDGVEGATFSKDGKFILTSRMNGGHSLIDSAFNQVVAEGIGLDVGFPQPEFGRYPNELLHQVRLSRDFWMSQFEITQAQYEAVVGENPSANATDPNLPVENVSWHDALAFCQTLNEKFPPPDGYTYRLPTDAEWEYACRAGADGPYAGTRRGQLRQVADYIESLDSLGWFLNNSDGTTHPVGKKKANGFGLHDMHGNVWEWCLDQVEQNKGRMLESCRPGAIDPFWREGSWRTLRGGCSAVTFDRCRSAYRGANAPEVKRGDRGFRIVLGPDLEAERLAGKEENATHAPILKAEQKRVLEKLEITLVPIPAGAFLKGSPGSLRAMRAALSDKGQLMAHADIDGTIKILQLPDKAKVSATNKLPSPATSLDLSPNGKYLLTGSHDGIARLWDAKTGKLLRNCEGHSAAVVSVAFSPDGKRFATGSLDGSCRLWNPANGKTTQVLQDPNVRFHRLSFGPEGKRILTSGPGAKPELWNCETGQRILSLKVDPEQVTSARFSPNGVFAAVATRG
ncbi:MAG: SUMF1/EgtB/PvdO family nonheme iron enzyme, partial [Opitutales bacterium]